MLQANRHLGHNSKVAHRADARRAQVALSPLGEYERKPGNDTAVKLRDARAKQEKIAELSSAEP
jgi:hypothetical protein